MAIETAPVIAPASLVDRSPRILARSAATLPITLKVVVVLLFLPEESSFEVAGLRLTAIRVIFFLLLPLIIRRLVQRISCGRYRFVLSDLFFPLAGLWMIIAPANIIGTNEALKHSGPIVLEFCVGYFATRTLLSSHGQAVALVNLLCRVIAVVALLGLADPLTHHFFTRDLVAKLTGYVSRLSTTPDAYEILTRMGVLRATSTLEHPIALGVICAIGFLFSAYLPLRSRRFTMLSCGLGVVISITSGAIQGILLAFCLMIYDKIMKIFKHRWMAIIIFTIMLLIISFTMVDNPLGFIFRHLVFDQESGYYRLYTWQVSTAALANSPWLGLGFEMPADADIPTTVDSVWLESALTFGIPGSLLIGLSIIGSASLSTNGRRVDLTAAESKLGTILGIVIFLIVYWGFIVHYWGTDWIFIALLAGIRAHLGELGRLRMGS